MAFKRYFPILAGVTLIMIWVSLYMAFWYAPVEAFMGIVQKIFYFHVPSAIGAYLGFFLAFVFSVVYLLRPSDRSDAMAHAGVEVGLIFCAMVLTSGPMWARPIWGKFFVFDPQLTATLLLFLIYASYALLRAFASDSARIKKIAAVLAIFGFIDVPIIHVSVRKWGGTHPIVQREGGGGLHPDMQLALYVCMFTFVLLFATLYWLRVHVATQRDRLRELEEDADDMIAEAHDRAQLA